MVSMAEIRGKMLNCCFQAAKSQAVRVFPPRQAHSNSSNALLKGQYGSACCNQEILASSLLSAVVSKDGRKGGGLALSNKHMLISLIINSEFGVNVLD